MDIQCGNSYFTLSDKNIISLSIHGQILIPMIVLESWCNSAFKTVPGSSIWRKMNWLMKISKLLSKMPKCQEKTEEKKVKCFLT